MIQPLQEYPLRLSTDHTWGGQPYTGLLCPVCGFSYNHVGKTYEEGSGDDYAASWAGRGNLAVIVMEGECGHLWELCVGFHKGESFIFTRDFNTSRPEEEPDAAAGTP